MKTLQQSPLQTVARRAAIANPKHAEANRAALHRALGHPLQARLKLGAPDDAHEREADAVAERVMAMPEGAAQRKCEACQQDDEEIGRQDVGVEPLRIRRFTGPSVDRGDDAPDSVGQVLASSGRPLEPALRRDMERRFGYGFSEVRIHNGTTAERSASEIGARAYTAGKNVVFGANQFAPGAREGRLLLAHELTHVIQQGSADASIVSAEDSGMEDSTLRKHEGCATDARAGNMAQTVVTQFSSVQAVQRASCPCCADSISIGNITRIDNATHMGHSFDVSMGLSYPASGPAGSCTLEWWEKTNVPAIPGHRPNTWTDMYGLYSVSPTFDPWKNRSETCGTSSPVTITDPPALAKRPGRTVNRTLEFRIVINSMPASSAGGCSEASREVTAKQVLSMVSGAPDWSASSFTTP